MTEIYLKKMKISVDKYKFMGNLERISEKIFIVLTATGRYLSKISRNIMMQNLLNSFQKNIDKFISKSTIGGKNIKYY